MCARHIYENWAKTYKGDKLQLQFWQLAKSANMADFRIAKEGLLQLTKEGCATLFQLEPKHWCKAFFSEEFKCDNVDNNICEVFNSKIIDARCKPVILMLEDIRVVVMTRLQKQRDEVAKWTRQYGPRIAKKLDENFAASRHCHPIWNGDDRYEIMKGADKYVVNLGSRKCSCRAWQVSEIPCAHAICAIQLKGNNTDNYIYDWYHKSKYLASHQFMMQPIRNSKFWEPTDHEAPQPLPLKKKIGRTKRRRRMAEGEVSGQQRMSRQGAKITCSYCRLAGHNIKGCQLMK
ncbi:uncharacterized protein [Rutidosis leptorrhynchoides]|uniref:uncharacterized protein n=1 Tax=Rutidosis leptorrhynchoides TaxID=125765 RepID=UPI003A99221D